jgi:hypothetical protein
VTQTFADVNLEPEALYDFRGDPDGPHANIGTDTVNFGSVAATSNTGATPIHNAKIFAPSQLAQLLAANHGISDGPFTVIKWVQFIKGLSSAATSAQFLLDANNLIQVIANADRVAVTATQSSAADAGAEIWTRRRESFRFNNLHMLAFGRDDNDKPFIYLDAQGRKTLGDSNTVDYSTANFAVLSQGSAAEAVSHIAIYTSALSDANLEALYNNGAGTYPT